MTRPGVGGAGAVDALWERIADAATVREHDTGQIALWRGSPRPLSVEEVEHAARRGWLTAQEKATAARKATVQLMGRYGTRRLVRRLVVAATLGRSPAQVEIEMRCPWCDRRDHGAPRVTTPGPDHVHLSSSSAHDHVATVVGTTSVGVDVEDPVRLAGVSLPRLASGVPGWRAAARFCPPDASPAQVWTAVEALGKAVGRGLLASEREVTATATTHRLSWWADDAGVVTCVAARGARPAIATIELPCTTT